MIYLKLPSPTRIGSQGFSIVEVIVSLVILVSASLLGIGISNMIDRASLRSIRLNELSELEFLLLTAIEDPKSYVDIKQGLRDGLLLAPPAAPPISYRTRRYDGQELNLGRDDGATKVTYVKAGLRGNCASPTDRECPYMTEVSVTAGATYTVTTRVDFNPNVVTGEMSFATLTNPNPFQIPPSYYMNNNETSCPNDGNIYIGVQSFQWDPAGGVTNTVCWKFDSTNSCANDEYPVGLKILTGVSPPTVGLDCKKLYGGFDCPADYGANTYFPLNPDPAATSYYVNPPSPFLPLTGKCVPLVKPTTPPRFRTHLISSFPDPTVPGGNFGLMYLKVQVCPLGYKLQSIGAALSPGQAISNLFYIRDSQENQPCGPAPVPFCVSHQEGSPNDLTFKDTYYCSMCRFHKPGDRPAPSAGGVPPCATNPTSPYFADDQYVSNLPFDFSGGAPVPLPVSPNCTKPKLRLSEGARTLNPAAAAYLGNPANYTCVLQQTGTVDGI